MEYGGGILGRDVEVGNRPVNNSSVDGYNKGQG